ncbi:hypothetical protein Tco_0965219 [Tanacetum coccineum]
MNVCSHQFRAIVLHQMTSDYNRSNSEFQTNSNDRQVQSLCFHKSWFPLDIKTATITTRVGITKLPPAESNAEDNRLVAQPGKDVPTQNSFANLKEEESELDKGLNVSSPVKSYGKDNEKKVDSMVVNEEANSQNQDCLICRHQKNQCKIKASKEASSSKFTSLDDDDSDDDEEVYMPDGIYGGGFMDSLEDDLDCYECYRTQVYDLTPQEQAFCDQYDIRLNSHGRN